MTEPRSASDVCMDLIVAFLTPMFVTGASGDVNFARIAAIETVNAYQAHTTADLLTIAQIVAFGLTALGSLSLSMADNLSLSMTLRLRANAIASNRAAERCRCSLVQSDKESVLQARHHLGGKVAPEAGIVQQQAVRTLSAQPVPPEASPAMVPPHAERPAGDRQIEPPAEDQQTKPAPADQRRVLWAKAMADAAAEVLASLPNLPPAERREASIRAAAMSSVANQILAANTARLPRRFDPRHPDQSG
jgi:hypothetical protein